MIGASDVVGTFGVVVDEFCDCVVVTGTSDVVGTSGVVVDEF